MHPSEAQIRDSVRVTYPADWDVLLNEFIDKDTTRIKFEDGPTFIDFFAQLANLSKIIHRMIIDVFENRKDSDPGLKTASIKSIHLALTKWATELPAKLHWNQWVKSTVPSYVLQLQ